MKRGFFLKLTLSFLMSSGIASAGQDLSALLGSHCFDLLSAPISTEERIGELYSRLLREYRNLLNDEVRYEKTVEGLLKEDFYSLSGSHGDQAHIVALFKQLGEIDSKGRLPNGQYISSPEIRARLKAHLEEELGSLRKVRGAVEAIVKETTEIRPPHYLMAGDARLPELPHLSPDQTKIIGISKDGTLVTWDRRTGKVLDQYRVLPQGRASMIHYPFHLEVSPDFTRALIISPKYADNFVVLWDLVQKREIRRFDIAILKDATTIKVSPDLSKVVVDGREKIALIDLASGETIRSIPARRGATKLFEVDSDFTRLMQTTHENLLVWNFQTEKDPRIFPFSGEDYTLRADKALSQGVGVTKKGKVVLWDLLTPKIQSEFSFEAGQFPAIIVSDDFTRAVVWTDKGSLQLVDLVHEKVLRSINRLLPPGSNSQTIFGYSNFSRIFISTYRDGQFVVDFATGQVLFRMTGKPNRYVERVMEVPELNALIGVVNDGSTIYWDMTLVETLQ